MIKFLKRLKAGLRDWLEADTYTEVSEELHLESELRRGIAGGP